MGPVLKTGAVVYIGLNTGGVVGHKNSTDGGTSHRIEDIIIGIFI